MDTSHKNGVESGAEITACSLARETLSGDTPQQTSAAGEFRSDGLAAHAAGRKLSLNSLK
ncbi:MAG: hypothetical protein WCK86_09580 [Planctomycetia bacterium]